jgi:hypothetical protein
MSDGGTLRQRAQAGAQIRTPYLPPLSDQCCWRGDFFEIVKRGIRIGSRADRTWQSCPNGPVLPKGRFPSAELIPGRVGFHSGQSPSVLRLQTQLSATPDFDAPEARVPPRRPGQKRGSAGWGRDAGRKVLTSPTGARAGAAKWHRACRVCGPHERCRSGRVLAAVAVSIPCAPSPEEPILYG